ncbi:hypothetical protein BpHYR1_008868 [Brachionus plicatilis]|uniref:Uncharacterized protein n=1 Tax=Brachionus plicatilis TaxID=10195 RepID=A0A3M7Q026_BRAPC|nr:hypothetical protein BpHYR1_008868 [Brachionus plicatilis]
MLNNVTMNVTPCCIYLTGQFNKIGNKAQLRLNHHHHKRCLLDLHHRQLNLMVVLLDKCFIITSNVDQLFMVGFIFFDTFINILRKNKKFKSFAKIGELTFSQKNKFFQKQLLDMSCQWKNEINSMTVYHRWDPTVSLLRKSSLLACCNLYYYYHYYVPIYYQKMSIFTDCEIHKSTNKFNLICW